MMFSTRFAKVLFSVMLLAELLLQSGHAANLPTVNSPDGDILVALSLGGEGVPSFTASFEGAPMVSASPLGLCMEAEHLVFTNGLQFVGHEGREIDERYSMPTGKQSERRNHCNEAHYVFRNAADVPCTAVFRVFNEGIAFRYEVGNSKPSQVFSEVSGFVVAGLKHVWSIPFSSGDERQFAQYGADGLPEGARSFPVLAETERGSWMLFAEAHVSDYPLSSGRFEGGRLDYDFARPKEGENTVPENFVSPWRVMMFGRELSDMVRNCMVDHLSPPAEGDYSWVQAGVNAFPWWGENLANSSPESLKKYIDLSAAMGWPYIEFDLALVNSPARAREDWKTTPWLKDVVDYGLERGVRCFGWEEIKNLNTPEKRKDIFTRYNKLGVAGCKVDFINSYSQRARRVVEEIIRDAAKHKLMLSFHGAQSPRGFARTYPHVMTFEAVHACEYYLPINKSKGVMPSHNCTLPFTRNVLGSMDYTPVAFTSKLRKTTMAHELALAVVYESGWQGMCDVPEAYLESVARPFMSGLPAAWDETRLLDGYPGEFCIMARRKGETWYVGGISATEARKVSVDLSSIIDRNHKIILYEDRVGEKDALNAREMVVSSKNTSDLTLKTNGGFAFIIKPQ